MSDTNVYLQAKERCRQLKQAIVLAIQKLEDGDPDIVDSINADALGAQLAEYQLLVEQLNTLAPQLVQ